MSSTTDPTWHADNQAFGKMLRRRWKWLGCLGIVALAVGSFLTGGLVISCSADFGGQCDIELTPGLEADVWLSSKGTRWSIPFLLHYRSSYGPYSLRLQIWDTSKTIDSITVSEVLLEYGDGQTVRITDKWERKLGPHTQVNSLSGKVFSTEMLGLGDEIQDLVKRHVRVKITLTGYLRKVTGGRIPFQASESFDPENRTDFYTFWAELAGC